MKRLRIVDVIDKSERVKKSTATNMAYSSKYIGFTPNYVFMYLDALDTEGREHRYRINLNNDNHRKIIREAFENNDEYFIRTFTESIKKINDGRLKTIVDLKIYL